MINSKSKIKGVMHQVSHISRTRFNQLIIDYLKGCARSLSFIILVKLLDFEAAVEL